MKNTKRKKNRFSIDHRGKNLYQDRMGNVFGTYGKRELPKDADLSDIKATVKNQTTETAIRIFPYFKEALEDPDPKVRKLAEEGLKFIKDNYPNL